jgi:uncharacterized protein (DUF2164 family)
MKVVWLVYLSQDKFELLLKIEIIDVALILHFVSRHIGNKYANT